MKFAELVSLSNIAELKIRYSDMENWGCHIETVRIAIRKEKKKT